MRNILSQGIKKRNVVNVAENVFLLPCVWCFVGFNVHQKAID